MSVNKIFLLESVDYSGTRRLLSDRLPRELAENSKTVVVTVTRTGTFFDPRYGEFEITKPMLLSMIENFKKNVFGQEIVLDRAHKPSDGACGFFRDLFLSDNKLRAKIELTDFGVESITQRGFIYVSAEFADNFVDNEQRKEHGPTLLGAGLTPRPVIKHLDPIRLQLSENSPDGVPVYLSDRIAQLLKEDISMNIKELMSALRKKLSEFNLAEAIITQLISAYEDVATKVADADIQRTLMEAFASQGKMLSESLARGATDIKLDFSGLNLGKTLSADDVAKMLAEHDQKRVQQHQAAADALAKNKSDYIKQLSDAKELDGIPDNMRKTLLATADLVTGDMSAEQVKSLALQQITLGQQMVASLKLAQQGYNLPRGAVHISVDDSNNIKSLQETMDRRLGISDMPHARRFMRTGGALAPENKEFVEKVLAQFDAEHGAQLYAEHKLLAGGDSVVSDVAVPAGFERTVIREALYNLVAPQFLDVSTLPFASSHLIPYSYRDTAAAGRNNTRVYEGGAIPRAAVKQAADTAYLIPQKIAFEVSDELRYLTSNGMLDWNAAAENQRNASRIIAEDTEQMAFNEILRAADEYGSVAVSNENLEPQSNGTNRVFVLANFPVVRPRMVYDLQGAQVGSTANPIVVSYNSVALSEYDGTGTQAAGTYYVINYNLGEIYLVNQAGAIQTPADTVTYTVSYSYATNVAAFNTDEGSADLDAHWDGFLYRYGLRKSLIEDTRSHMANFGLMSGNLMTAVEQAKKFAANFKVPGTELQSNGNLGRVKDVSNYKTTAPGLWMGDQRAIIGERGVTRMRMCKPWTMSELENQKDANGRFTGKKEAYGDQFIIMHTPSQLKQAYTSIVAYSAEGRVARVSP